jgi:hypothetical protein
MKDSRIDIRVSDLFLFSRIAAMNADMEVYQTDATISRGVLVVHAHQFRVINKSFHAQN